MEPEDIAFRVVYTLFFIVLGLMTWAMSVKAEGQISSSSSPCSFNLLCSCSKPGPIDYGIVSCHGVLLTTLPSSLNSSRAFSLSMRNNELQILEGKQLTGSGLWRLEITSNELYHIEPDAFWGLSKSLTELDLSNNELIEIPPVQSLTKLRVLNLDGNQLIDIDSDLLPSSLTFLSLANNLVINLLEAVFSNLPKLEKLELSCNSIYRINPNAFSGLTQSMTFLNLEGNLLRNIPFEAVMPLQKLQSLDLSQNLITSLSDTNYSGGRLSLTSLNLALNRISIIPSLFLQQNFGSLTSLNLSSNPLTHLGDEVFKGTFTKYLDLSHCYIQEIYPKTFHGLETSLKSLNLGFNNISYFPMGLFSTLQSLSDLILDYNPGNDANDNSGLFSHLKLAGPSLHHLSILGSTSSLNDLKLAPNVRQLHLSSLGDGVTTLTSKLFEGLFSSSLQKLQISHAKLKAIFGSVFVELSGLKELDLSENRIQRLDEATFQGLGHSLVSLNLANGLRMNNLPAGLLDRLPSLNHLDLSSGSLVTLSDTLFAHNSKLRHLNLRFNKLSSLPQKIFSPDKTPSLEAISVSINSLIDLEEGAFSNLKSLTLLELNDNLISYIHPRTFQNLNSLSILNLAGNRLTVMEDETFINLPHLSLLDLSHNHLNSLNIAALEQCGTLASFKVDASWNQISILGQIPPLSFHPDNSSGILNQLPHPQILPSSSSSSIQVLDLSHNNISVIVPSFFAPISTTLLDLNLSWNSLKNLTWGHLRVMKYLQRLSVNNNHLDMVEYNAFKDAKFIQVLSLDNNFLRDLPSDLFEECRNLRVFSVFQNKLRTLPDSIFKDAPLQHLNLAGNQLTRFPSTTLSQVSSTLTHLDLSFNQLSSLTSNQIEFLTALRSLSLESNRLVVLGEGTFFSLNHLLFLNLGGNTELGQGHSKGQGQTVSKLFESISQPSIRHLHIANMSLRLLPDEMFPAFPHLQNFNCSHNELRHFPSFGNNSAIRVLDLGWNEIEAIPKNLPSNLNWLSLSGNPISSLNNDSFIHQNINHHLNLHTLVLSHLPLNSVQIGTLRPLKCLSFLKFGPHLQDLPFPGSLIQDLNSLQHLHLMVDTPTLTPSDIFNSSSDNKKFPQKLSKLTLEGQNLISISSGILNGIQTRSFSLSLENTGLTQLSSGVTSSIGEANKFSIDLDQGNDLLQVVDNPNKKGRLPTNPAIYHELSQLILPSQISCTCDNSGWVQFWLRKWIHKNCPLPLTSNDHSWLNHCAIYLSSMRRVKCCETEEMLSTSLELKNQCEELDMSSSASNSIIKSVVFLLTTSVLFIIVQK